MLCALVWLRTLDDPKRSLRITSISVAIMVVCELWFFGKFIINPYSQASTAVVEYLNFPWLWMPKMVLLVLALLRYAWYLGEDPSGE